MITRWGATGSMGISCPFVKAQASISHLGWTSSDVCNRLESLPRPALGPLTGFGAQVSLPVVWRLTIDPVYSYLYNLAR